jgi:hypothetical protein
MWGLSPRLPSAEVRLWNELPEGMTFEHALKRAGAWPPLVPDAFAVSPPDFLYRTTTYGVFRRPVGGGRDVIRWTAPGESRLPSSKSTARATNRARRSRPLSPSRSDRARAGRAGSGRSRRPQIRRTLRLLPALSAIGLPIRKSAALRPALLEPSGRSPDTNFPGPVQGVGFMQLSIRRRIIVAQCGPIDLVAG